MSEAERILLHRQLHEAVAATIRLCRIEADVSQDQAAYRLKWPRSLYIARESGSLRTSVAEFILIASVLMQNPVRMLAQVLLQYSLISSGQITARPPPVARRQGRIRGFVPPSGAPLRKAASTTTKRKLHGFHVATAIAIRACRLQADLNQTELGTQLGLSRRGIGGLEGSARVPVSLFILIAPAVNLTPEELLTEVLRA